ncbi:YihY/virulence factor BrkB family protein [Streptomyces meridianus]|uniref:YihY/virulence factor BrkB family protein n=1 Tax=Streptomyces meridianus TaxID=2938945 RepID=A0ABT0X5Y2_9ACTN|nr:YihY/virulence factor BrkB family protein [Streptomyces meridianus]MCM2577948.1 YihY/virulence factor BrkB family protein [Streptomyces meridianus]
MERLTRIPVLGPAIARLMRTHAWHAYERLEEVHWSRLAAAITFVSFVAVFPLITVAAAVGATLLSPTQLGNLKLELAQQVPGISDRLDIDGLVANAGTVGAIAGAALFVTGVGWVGSLRECLRAVWGKEEDPGNPVVRKARDGVVLIGLAGIGFVAMGGSALASGGVGRLAELLGIDEGAAGRVLLFAAGLAIAVLADLLLLAFVLTRLPRVHPARRTVLIAGLIGALGFELLKVLLSGYLQGVASRSMYGAFGVPVALLLWINLMARLLLYCAAWTAVDRTGAGTVPVPEPEPGPAEPGAGPEPGPASRPLTAGGSGPEGASGGAPGTPPPPGPQGPRP